MRALRQLRFDYAERMAPLALARALASELEVVPPRDVLLALYGVPLVRRLSCSRVHSHRKVSLVHTETCCL